MSIQLLSSSHQFYSTTDAADAFFGKVLEGDFATVTVEVHTIVCCGIAMSGQRVVGTAGIVASTLTGILPKEDAASIHYALC